MICINSTNEPTKVINSRSSKKNPLVWRRRQGLKTGIIFTTYERPALSENKKIQLANGLEDTFNLGKLVLSIASAFSHNQRSSQYDSLWLAQTVEDKLSMETSLLTPLLIATTTYEVLKQFDELAAVQYAAKYQLITTVRRRGRPSFS